MAFETVCPDRIDMIHKNYRKLCNLLVDVDEWGQVMILNMLTRYARTQFLNPNEAEVRCKGGREGGREGREGRSDSQTDRQSCGWTKFNSWLDRETDEDR